MINNKALEQLARTLPPGMFSTAEEERVAYSYDGTWAEALPGAVAHPLETEHVAALVRVAGEQGIPVVPRGAGTGLAGGSVPLEGSICLNLARMNRILEISAADSVAVVQPGVVTHDLQQAAARAGRFYPPDPASLYQCTIGGNAATNAGGPRCLKYGVTADYVLGLEIVLPDATIMRTGGRTIKNVTGYNLTQLFIGSEGTLGVITEITLRLIPRPAAQRTALAAFPRLRDACLAVEEILQGGILPLVTELMDQATTRAVEEFKHLGLPSDVDALLLVAVDGSEEEVVRDIDSVAETLRRAGASEVRRAVGPEESEALWEARRCVSAAIARLGRNKLGEDITVPRGRIPEMVERLQEIGRDHGLAVVTFGHIGDGNLHPNILCDRRDAEQMKRVEKASAEIMEAAVALGGTLSGEHGIGIFKRGQMRAAVDATALAWMASIKRLFDPRGIMNPGKKLPAW